MTAWIEDLSSGMVSAAVFTQLLGDALPELVVACEWGEVIILENRAGAFRRWKESGMSQKSRSLPSRTPGRVGGPFGIGCRWDGHMVWWQATGESTTNGPIRGSLLWSLFSNTARGGILSLIEGYRSAPIKRATQHGIGDIFRARFLVGPGLHSFTNSCQHDSDSEFSPTAMQSWQSPILNPCYS